MHLSSFAALVASAAIPAQQAAEEQDWRAHRGSDRKASSSTPVPQQWDAETNILWQSELPGPGSSSPILVGDSIYLTCWTGPDAENQDPKDLKRHLICIDRASGEINWTVAVDRAAKEDPYEGRLANHGYASSTPVSDGERVYVFFGKAGVYAFDLAGTQLWRADVGDGSSRWNTGSGSSPCLWNNRLFINAADESQSVIALEASSGEQLWSRSAKNLDQAYDTPIIWEADEPVLLFSLLAAIWGLDPETGEELWQVETGTNGAMAPNIILENGIAYSLGGQTKNRAHALRLAEAGGREKPELLWARPQGSYVSTPLFYAGHLYWVDKGVAHCMAAATGELVYRERLEGDFYASLVRAGDAIYAVSRTDGTYVYAASPEFELHAHNRIESDESRFQGTPALSGGRIYLRSNRYLYCIGEEG